MYAELEKRFRLRERGTNVPTEVRAGITTFVVMAYVIFVNPAILTLNGDQAAQASGAVASFPALVTATCLAAGVTTLAMGLATNYPFALAPGMGLNAVVAFDLIAARKLPWTAAMGFVVLEGIVITAFVLTGLRERVMHAVPLSLKRAIGVGIGFFIMFIGLVNAGFVRKGAGTPVTLGDLTRTGTVLALGGLLVTLWLLSRRVKAALLAGIAITTVAAIGLKLAYPHIQVSSVASAADLRNFHMQTVDFSTIGKGFDMSGFRLLGLLPSLLVVLSLVLSDFFDTMGTSVALANEAGFLDEAGRLPGVGRVLLVDALAAFFGGALGASSVTTYIESAAGISEGARSGLSVSVTGLLFLIAIVLAPLAALVPPEATAPALIIVGFLMLGSLQKIEFTDLFEGFPALLTIAVMPFTYSITNGIGAGVIAHVFLRLAGGRGHQVSGLMAALAVAFVVYFAAPAFI